MWVDIFLHNKKYLLKTLDNFNKDINKLKRFIKNSDEEKIFETLKRNKEIRKSILKIR